MDLNIRNVEEGLVKALKLGAAQRGVTLREYVIEKLSCAYVEVITDGDNKAEKDSETKIGDSGGKDQKVRKAVKVAGDEKAVDPGRDDGGDLEKVGRKVGGKRLSWEEFWKLGPTEKMRAQREGRSPERG